MGKTGTIYHYTTIAKLLVVLLAATLIGNNHIRCIRGGPPPPFGGPLNFIKREKRHAHTREWAAS